MDSRTPENRSCKVCADGGTAAFQQSATFQQDASCGTVTVLPAFNATDVTASCNLETPEVIQGEEQIEILVTVNNNNPTTADAQVTAIIGGNEPATANLTIGANGVETTTMTFAPPSDPGDYGIDIDLVAQRG